MIDFSKLRSLATSRGVVKEIRIGSLLLWRQKPKASYVSLGDSIAAGQGAGETRYYTYPSCLDHQYGAKGLQSTPIQENTYAYFIREKLQSIYGEGNVSAVSYARSGDTNDDLRDKLEHTNIQEAVSNADIITVCIGANSILGKAGDVISDYIANGSSALYALEAELEPEFAKLASNANTYGSYQNIFAKIKSLNKNKNAKFVFTTVHNPYKYLWVDPSTGGNNYTDGYFGPVFYAVPDMNVSIPFVGEMNLRKYVYENTMIKALTERINGAAGDGSDSLGQWVERWLSRLNGIIKNAIATCGDSRFILADSNSVFDSYPDLCIRANHNYSDLVNVDIVRGRNIGELDWAQFWYNFDVSQIANITNALNNAIENVIMPDVDPHPKAGGQYALYRTFADALDLESLTRYELTYDPNGASGAMPVQEVVGVGYAIDGTAIDPYADLDSHGFAPGTGYYHAGWSSAPSGGNTYSVGQAIPIRGNTTVYAQWSDVYTLTLICRAGDGTLTGSDSDTGVTSSRMCYVNGGNVLTNRNFGSFKNSPDRISVAYGTEVSALIGIVSNRSGGVDPRVTLNGSTVQKFGLHESIMPNGYGYSHIITKDTTIEFVWYDWRVGGINIAGDAYWDCSITEHQRVADSTMSLDAGVLDTSKLE